MLKKALEKINNCDNLSETKDFLLSLDERYIKNSFLTTEVIKKDNLELLKWLCNEHNYPLDYHSYNVAAEFASIEMLKFFAPQF